MIVSLYLHTCMYVSSSSSLRIYTHQLRIQMTLEVRTVTVIHAPIYKYIGYVHIHAHLIIRTVVRIVGMGRMSHIYNIKCSRL